MPGEVEGKKALSAVVCVESQNSCYYRINKSLLNRIGIRLEIKATNWEKNKTIVKEDVSNK